MSNNIIIINNYRLELNLLPTYINIKLTDTILCEEYECYINKNDIYIKSINKFYKMIINSLNKEPNYNFIIDHKITKIIFIISYNTEIVDIDEQITFVKITDTINKRNNNIKIKEIFLIDIIKELLIVLYCLTIFLIKETFLMFCTLTKLLILLIKEFNYKKPDTLYKSSTHEIINNKPDEIIINNKPDEIILNNTSDEIIINNKPDDIILNNKPDEIINNKPDDIILNNTSDEIIINNKPDEIINNKPDEIIINNKPDDIILNNTSEEIIINNKPDDIILNNTSDDIIINNKPDDIILNNTSDDIIINNTSDEINNKPYETL